MRRCGGSGWTRATRAWVHAKHPDAVTSPCVPATAAHPVDTRMGLYRAGARHGGAAARGAGGALPDARAVLIRKCAPHTLRDTIRQLDAGTSWLDLLDRPNNGYTALRQFSRVQRPGRILKSDQWSLLARPHAQRVLDVYDKDPTLTEFQHVQAADEIFVPTALQPRPGADRVRPTKAVYVDWSVSCKHPREFTHAEGPAALARARALGALFLRKVPDALGSAAWAEWTSCVDPPKPPRPALAPAAVEALRRQYPYDTITVYHERIWSEEECWRYVHAATTPAYRNREN